MLSDLLSFISLFNIEVGGLFQNLLLTYFFLSFLKWLQLMICITYIFMAVMAQAHIGRDVSVLSPDKKYPIRHNEGLHRPGG